MAGSESTGEKPSLHYHLCKELKFTDLLICPLRKVNIPAHRKPINRFKGIVLTA
jgi:hypothetical protein